MPHRTAADEIWQRLLQQIAAGDQQALSDLYDTASQLVFGMALRMLRDRGAAEEVMLDVFMLVWKQAHSFDATRGRAMTWLMAITRNRAIDRMRAAAWLRRDAAPIEDALPHAVSGDSPENDLQVTETGQRVRAALAQLKPGQRQLIEVAYFDGLSHQELADHFRLPLGTVKTRIRAGMLRLRELLDSGAAQTRTVAHKTNQ
ncbi:MAG: sigma-70 family RNA polymerase sigma factor [Blastocatellia bacterium]